MIYMGVLMSVLAYAGIRGLHQSPAGSMLGFILFSLATHLWFIGSATATGDRWLKQLRDRGLRHGRYDKFMRNGKLILTVILASYIAGPGVVHAAWAPPFSPGGTPHVLPVNVHASLEASA
jgi:hypothetical protein